MALITCPKCGKQISDTAGKCIHCGYDLRESKDGQTELKEYYKLPSAEQKALRAEFYKTDPAYAECDRRADKTKKKFSTFATLGVTFGSIAIIISIIVKILNAVSDKKFEDYNIVLVGIVVVIMVISFLMLMISSILMLVLRIKFRKHRYNQLIIEKRYQKWLRSEKAITYKVQFTEKQKRDKAFFDEINVDRTQLEV